MTGAPARIAVTAGEPAGIGPELLVRLAQRDCAAQLVAIADPDNLWAVPSSYFSVIAPEGAAAILHRDAGRAAEVAGVLHVGPRELEALGIVRGVVGSA